MDIEQLLWQALSSPYGIEIQTTNAEAFKRKFYTARASAREKGILDFDKLQCKLSPKDPKTIIWILIKGERSDKQDSVRESDDTPV